MNSMKMKERERIVCPYCGSFLIEVSPLPPEGTTFRRPCPKCKHDVTVRIGDVSGRRIEMGE